MGIYVKLESPQRVSPLAWALTRLHFSYETIKYFQEGHVFVPETVAIWLKASSETMGGKRIDEKPIKDIYETIETLRNRFVREFYPNELFSSVVVFNGKWNLDGEELDGFVSANNEPSWRSAYFDVEIDLYAKGEIEDLVDFLWRKPDLENVFANFTKHLKRTEKGQSAKPMIIYFSVGAPEYGEVDNLVALDLPDRRRFVDFLYAKLHKKKEAWVKDRIDPFDRTFFVSAVHEQRAVEEIFAKIGRECSLIEQPGGSVIYLAKERGAFAEFYKGFEKMVFKPISEQLPEAKEIKSKMVKGLEHIESFG